MAGSAVAALGGCSAAPLGSSTSTRPLPDPFFEREFSVGKHDGVDPHPFVASGGAYAVDVSLDGGAGRTFRWRVVEKPTWYGVWIAFTPDGDLFTCGTVESDCATPYPVET